MTMPSIGWERPVLRSYEELPPKLPTTRQSTARGSDRVDETAVKKVVPHESFAEIF